jgi:chemotaxis protein CheD
VNRLSGIVDLVTVGVADCRVSNAAEAVLATNGLGSCIALAIHDPVAAVGGILHYMLPESSLNPSKAAENPFLFADTGIPLLFQAAYRLGADKRRLVVRAAGAAQLMDDDRVFNIGRCNHLALRKILGKAGVMIHVEDIGGTSSRTLRLEIATGRLFVRGPDMIDREMPLPSGKGGHYGTSCPDPN